MSGAVGGLVGRVVGASAGILCFASLLCVGWEGEEYAGGAKVNVGW